MRGLGEGGGHLGAVAIVIVERDVAGRLLVDQRRTRSRRLLRPDNGRSESMATSTASAASLACSRSRRPRKRRIAHPAHLVGGECRSRRPDHRRAVAVVERHDAFERAVRRDRRRYRPRARPASRVRTRDRSLQHAVGNAAADHHRVGLAGKLDVVGVAALAAHQDRILGAHDRLADAELHQGEAVRIVLQIHEPGCLIRYAGRKARAGQTRDRAGRGGRGEADRFE